MATVTLKGKPVEISGQPPRVGDQAPAFDLVANNMDSVKLSDSDGKIRVLSVVPSVDTSVCSLQTVRFNREFAGLPESVIGYTISVDTPFAQGRYCGAEGIEKVQLLSDYKGNTFGHDWGLYIQDMGALARSVFIVDKNGVIAYEQIVPEISQEPDYDAVLAKVKELAG
jgi:thiol peroxidase